jgi:hypothetical protein
MFAGAAEQARRAIINVKMPLAFLESGASSSISGRSKDFVYLCFSERAICIDTADGGTMETHFYGTTCTYVKGDDDKWLVLVQDNVLYVTQAGEDLLSLGKIMVVRYKCTLHERELRLLDVDFKRMDQVALIVTAVNDVFPILVKSMKRSEADARQVNEVLLAHGGALSLVPELAFSAFPRVVGAKQVGEANLVNGEGEGYINHSRFGLRSGAAARMSLADIPPGTYPACMATGMPNPKERDEGKRRAEYFLQYFIVDAQGPPDQRPRQPLLGGSGGCTHQAQDELPGADAQGFCQVPGPRAQARVQPHEPPGASRVQERRPAAQAGLVGRPR